MKKTIVTCIVALAGCSAATEQGAAPDVQLGGVQENNVAAYGSVNYTGGSSYWTETANAPTAQMDRDAHVTLNGSFFVADHDTATTPRYGGAAYVREVIVNGAPLSCSGDIWQNCSSGSTDYCLPDYAGGPQHCWTKSGVSGGQTAPMSWGDGTSMTVSMTTNATSTAGRHRALSCISEGTGTNGCGSLTQGFTGRAHAASAAVWPNAPSGFRGENGRYIGEAWIDEANYAAGFRAISAPGATTGYVQIGYPIHYDPNSFCDQDQDCGGDGRAQCIDTYCYTDQGPGSVGQESNSSPPVVDDLRINLPSQAQYGGYFVTCFAPANQSTCLGNGHQVEMLAF